MSLRRAGADARGRQPCFAEGFCVRKICVISGTRAEYGLLRPLIELIRDSQALQLQLVVTGMHLSPEFGLTYREIETDGFVIDRKVEMLLSLIGHIFGNFGPFLQALGDLCSTHLVPLAAEPLCT